MRVAVFNTKSYDREFLTKANRDAGHELVFFEPRLNRETSQLAQDFPGVCAFVNDVLDAEVLESLSQGHTEYIALRSAGFNNVDLEAAERFDIKIARVPAYSPHAVAEHTVALMLCLNRKIHRAHARIREWNFSLEGLLGFDFHGRTVGIIGTGRIGTNVARILHGFGCELLGYDVHPNEECKSLGMRYVDLETLFAESQVISLNCPLTAETHYLIDEDAIASMRDGVMVINVSRGAVIDTRAAIEGLKNGKIGSLGIDVYEEESQYFFQDLSTRVIEDDVLARLLTFPNVLVTGHQAFFTQQAISSIAEATIENFNQFERRGEAENQIGVEMVRQ
jgi:D-lactate dehydrogenase